MFLFPAKRADQSRHFNLFNHNSRIKKSQVNHSPRLLRHFGLSVEKLFLKALLCLPCALGLDVPPSAPSRSSCAHLVLARSSVWGPSAGKESPREGTLQGQDSLEHRWVTALLFFPLCPLRAALPCNSFYLPARSSARQSNR